MDKEGLIHHLLCSWRRVERFQRMLAVASHARSVVMQCWKRVAPRQLGKMHIPVGITKKLSAGSAARGCVGERRSRGVEYWRWQG